LKNLPKNIIVSNEDIDKLSNECFFTIFMSTGAAYNAIINGNIIFNLRSELNLNDNYLDIFEEDFPAVVSCSLTSIKKNLIDFIDDESKINQYIDEFKRLREYLVKGMNVVTDESLRKLI